MAYELGQAYVQIMPSAKGLSGSIASMMDGEASKAGTSAGGKFSTGFTGALGTLGKATAGALLAGTGALAAFGTSAVQAGMDFDSSMSQVAATMGLSMDQLMEETGSVDLAWGTFTGNLRDYAQEMGANTAFSATEAADALNYMALAGYDAQTSMEMLPNVLNLAAAGNMDLALASDMVTDTQSALGLSLDETSTMVDQMAKASSKSNTSVEQLGDAMLKIGATARSVKGGTQELSTMLGVLADNGIKGSEGGTHLRNILLSLQQACEDGTAYFEDIGIAVYDSDGNMRSMVDIVKDMKEELGGLSAESRDALLSGVFNKTDLAAVNALLGTSADRFDELSTEIGNAAGAAQKMADVQLDNLEGDITLFKSALEGTQIALSDLLTPALRDFVQMATDGLGDITEALRNGDIEGAAEDFGNMIGDGISKVVENLPTIVDAGGKLLSGLMQGITENVDSIADGIAQVAVSIAEFFGNNSGTFISGAMDIATSVVSSLITALPDILVSLGEGIVDGVMALLEGLPDMVFGIADAIANVFNTDFDGISEDYVRETQLIIDQSDLLEEAWEKVRKKKEEVISNADAEYDYYSQLAGELYTLIGSNHQVLEGEKDRADFIVTELATALGMEKEEVLKIAENNDLLSASLDTLLQKKHAEAVLDAERSAYEESLKQRQDLELQLVDVKEQLSDAEVAYQDYLNGTEAAIIRQQLGDNELADAMIRNNADKKSSLSELQAEYDELDQALSDCYINEQQYTTDYEHMMKEEYDLIGQHITEYTNTTEENVGQQLEQAQREYAGKKEAYDKVAALYASGDVEKKMLDSAEKELRAAEKNVSDLKKTQDEFLQQTILHGEGVVSAVETMTGDSFTVVDRATEQFGGGGAGWVDAQAAGVTSSASSVINALSGVGNDGVSTVRGFYGDFNSAGSYLMGGIHDGIMSFGDTLANALAGKVRAAIDAANAAADSHSPSRETKKLGRYIMQGLALGIEQNAEGAIRAAEQSTRDVISAMNIDADPSIALAGMDILSGSSGVFAGANSANGETVIYVTNNIDGAENPETFASRLARQLRMEMRMA